MKKMRLTAAFAAAVACASFSAVSASAADVIDFEDGNYSFVSMKTDGDGDNSKLSVVNFGGSKQLKVDVSDSDNVPKVMFDINSILPADKFKQVRYIELDVTIESKDGKTPVGWAGGAIGTEGGEDSPSWAQTDWELGDCEDTVSEQFTVQRKILLYGERLVNDTPDTHMIFMRWGTDVDYNIYIDNVRFLNSDKENHELDIKTKAAAETEAPTETTTVETTTTEAVTTTEAATTTEAVTTTEAITTTEEVTTAEVVETEPEVTETEPEVTEAPEEEQEPQSDEDTTSATTGNASSLAVGTAAVIAGYAVFMTKKRIRKDKTARKIR